MKIAITVVRKTNWTRSSLAIRAKFFYPTIILPAETTAFFMNIFSIKFSLYYIGD